jgi:hypothetical protein
MEASFTTPVHTVSETMVKYVQEARQASEIGANQMDSEMSRSEKQEMRRASPSEI